MSEEVALFGHDMFGNAVRPRSTGPVRDRFIIPPFTTLDARQGEWQERKRAWIAMGIQSELGRDSPTYGGQESPDSYIGGPGGKRKGATFQGQMAGVMGETGFAHGGAQRRAPQSLRPGGSGNAAGRAFGDKYDGGDVWAGHRRKQADSVTNVTGAPDLPEWANNGVERMVPGTSIFDPVLAELLVRWFSPPAGHVIDPFAGGSVRGIVTAALGRRYWGCDLRAEQVDANRAQLDGMELPVTPTWVVGDAVDMVPTAPMCDLVLTCPPYGDLERYSDDPRDLSTMDWPAFVAAYRHIIALTVARMRPDSFATFVVGDFRDTRSGYYRGFVAETIRAFVDAGAPLYNEGILINAAGTAGLRATRQFGGGRKLVKTHQNVLVFVKGRWKHAVGRLADEI